MGRSNPRVGFPLRCFQRLSNTGLSYPAVPTLDNRYTVGPSIPVLSY